MNIDIFKRSGHNKGYCEDSIVATDSTICLSDGCGSGKLPDIGSNIAAYACRNFKQEKAFPLFLDETLKPAYAALDANPHDLLATIVHLYIDEKNKVAHVNIVGDGCWFYVTGDGKLFAYSIEFTDNAPYFYQYSLQPEYEETWTRRSQWNQYLARIDDLCYPKKDDQELIFEDPEKTKYFHIEIPLNNVRLVGIASDGITSFVKKERNELGDRISLPANDVLQDLLTFKNPVGKCLSRRCQSYLQNLKDAHHYDDLSIGVAILGNSDDDESDNQLPF